MGSEGLQGLWAWVRLQLPGLMGGPQEDKVPQWEQQQCQIICFHCVACCRHDRMMV